MKKHIITLLLALIATTCTFAQQHQRKFNPEQFRAMLEEFITKEAGFTTEEAQAFYPIYHEMKDKQREIQHQIFRLKKGNCNGCEDKDYTAVIKEITSLNHKKFYLEEKYYQKMYETVDAHKVFKAMLAEDKFHRQVLDKIQKK